MFLRSHTSITTSPASEYLTMVAQLRGLPAKQSSERIDGMLRLLSLHDDRHASISGYSKGMRQKILLIAALMHNPELILLDEPFSGLDVGTSLVLRSLIQELAARGKVVLFSSHELDTVERVCSHVVILHRGKVVADDSIERLRSLMELPTLEAIFSQLAVEQELFRSLGRLRISSMLKLIERLAGYCRSIFACSIASFCCASSTLKRCRFKPMLPAFWDSLPGCSSWSACFRTSARSCPQLLRPQLPRAA